MAKGKLSYKLAALLITVAIFFVSSTGVSNVLAISGPLFTVLFPMSVVMTFLGLLKSMFLMTGRGRLCLYGGADVCF